MIKQSLLRIGSSLVTSKSASLIPPLTKIQPLSLNKVIYENFHKISILDSTNNWIISKSEKIKKIDGNFYTPSFPNRKINVLHYTNLSFNDNFIVEENNVDKKISISK